MLGDRAGYESSGNFRRALLACAMLTEQALHRRGADAVLLSKDTDGATGEVGLHQGLDVGGRQAVADLPGSRSWTIRRDQLGLFLRRWRLVADVFQDADQGFQEVVTVRVAVEELHKPSRAKRLPGPLVRLRSDLPSPVLHPPPHNAQRLVHRHSESTMHRAHLPPPHPPPP